MLNSSLNTKHSKLAMLIYIHGFNSSPASVKARLLKERLEALGHGADFLAPGLPHRPAEAAAVLDALVARYSAAALVGSSLGGYYATWLAEKHGIRAVLVNPAVRPYELLRPAVGVQRNLHTGAEYEFGERHLEELAALEVPAVQRPGRYLLMVETGDEVLDYRQAVARYRGCRQVVIEGGDHGFSDFHQYLDTVLEFCGVSGSEKH
jgi:predicted esterase YcpF (UPF0227 family)